MDINQLVSKELSKNILTNYFLKGMNTDTSDMLISNELYRYAENIRVITNTDNNSGEVRLIDGNTRVKIAIGEHLINPGDILAFDSIRNVGVLIVRDYVELGLHYTWCIYKLDLDSVCEDEDEEGEYLKVDGTLIFGPCEEVIWPTDLNNEPEPLSKTISTVLRWESDKNIKLYIADGLHNIMCIDLTGTYTSADFDLVFSYQKVLLDSPHVEISGSTGYLTSAVVQYAYRLYAENGAATLISALSNPLSLYKNRNSGFAPDKQTNKAVRITIPTTNSRVLNKIQIYRITYQLIGQLPTVDLIYDTFVSSVPMMDYGGSKIATISASEFLALYNLYTLPKILESKGDYLFAANVSYTQDKVDDDFGYFDARSYNVGAKADGVSIFQKEGNLYIVPQQWPSKDAVITNDAFNPSDQYNTYNEDYWKDIDGYNGVGPYVSWKYVKTRHTISAKDLTNNGTPTRTYRSGETYRFGIRLFDLKGNASSVKWIADIQIPNRYEFGEPTHAISPNTMGWNEVDDYTIEFKINRPNTSIAGYEIVQALRTIADRCTITEGIAGHVFDVKYLYESDDTSKRIDNRDWMTPVGFLSLQDIYAVSADNNSGRGYYVLAEFGNVGDYRTKFAMPKRSIIQVATPEYAYQPDDVKDLINSSENIYVETVKNYIPNYAEDNEKLSPYWYVSVEDVGNQVINEGLSPTQSSYYNGAIPTFSGETSFVRSNNDYAYSLGILHSSVQGETDKYFINPAVIYYNRNTRGINITFSVPGMSSFSTRMFKEDDDAQPRTNAFRLTKETTGSLSESIHYFNYITPSSASSGYYNSLYFKDNGNNNYTSKALIKEVAYTESPDYSSFANNKEFTLKNSIVSIDNKSFVNWTAPFIVNATSLETDAIKRLSKNDGDIVMNADSDSGTMYTDMLYPLGSGGRSILLKLTDDENNDFNINYNPGIMGMPQICIVAIKKHCVPYGGYDSAHILNTNYLSIGAFSLAENLTTIIANGGDAFMRIFTYNCAHEWYDPTYKRFIKNATVYAVPIETDIDIQAQHSNSLYGVTTDDYRVQDKASAFDGYAQSDDSYLYNTAYGTSTDIATWVSDTRSKGQVNNYDTRVHYSNIKTNNELIDSWLLFKAVDFLDVDSRYGKITALLLFKDKLIFWQNNASGILSVNERSLIKDSNSSQIILGTGGVLERFDYFSTIYGQKPNQHNQTHSDSTLYWWDGNNKEILAYSDGYNIIPLTTIKQIRNYINERDENTIPMLMYNQKNKEVVCNVVGDESIAYNEQIEAFTSVYKYTPVWYCCTNGINYTISPDESHPVCLYKEDTDKPEATLFGAEVKPAIEYVVNHANQYVKTFDIQTFGGRFYGGSEVQSLNDYDKHLIKGEHNTNPLSVLTFAYSTPLKLNSSTTGADVVTNREYDFRLNIPRATIQDYGGRMRGKTMRCRIESSSNNKDFSLQYITTKYRTSWT